MGSVIAMPFDWKPSRPTKAIGGSDIYRPARGNYALISAQCRNGAIIELRSYDSQDAEVSRQNWLSSYLPFYQIRRSAVRAHRVSAHGSQVDIYGWLGSYIPRPQYIFEGFLYNLHSTYNLYYSFKPVSFTGSISEYQFIIDNKSGSSREFVAPNSRSWLKLGRGKYIYFRPQAEPRGLSSSVSSAIQKSQGLIGYERLVTEQAHSSGWTFIDDHTEVRGKSSNFLDWSATVVEYGLP